jgi:hypothetical protein
MNQFHLILLWIDLPHSLSSSVRGTLVHAASNAQECPDCSSQI